ncbi:MAG: hypothetical protein AAF228_09260 [Pseudomonadota bacterium]
MTKRTKNGDNDTVNKLAESQDIDPRIIAIVRFLARRTAERDFAEAVAKQANENKNKEG